VEIQEVSVQETKYRNIIVRFEPSAGHVLVVGAHYDSHGDGNAGARFPLGYSEETHTPGADDNASGVAGLIELAQLLGQSTQRRAIELVAYTLEEPPHFRTEHMGSAWHARSLRRESREIELMISLEMIGYFSDEPQSQHYPVPSLASLYSDRGNFIALVGNLTNFGVIRKIKAAMSGATSLPVYSMNAPPMMQGIDFSDHLNYWNQGMPAIMVTDTAFMRNQNYHLPGDTFEKLDYGRMAKVVQGIYAFTQLP
jgi:Zn-dependent M28 family amino/carboxypeptidase